jgi:ATP:corrinoid adenosyltransferase
VKAVLRADNHGVVAAILKDMKFKYHMSIQNLEDQIFSHVQEHEMQTLRQRESQRNADMEDSHPRV